MASSTQKIEVSPTNTGRQKINLLLGKLPQEEDWPKTQGEIHSIRERLTNTQISRAMSWNDIFMEYERHMEGLVDSGLENDSRFFMIIVIATGTVAIGSAPRLHTTEHNQLKQVIYSGIRRCFRKIGSSGKLDDKLIQRYLGRVRDGTQLLKSLDRNPLYSRVYELPYIVPGMLSLFLCLNYKGGREYISREILEKASPPPELWDSKIISTSNIVSANIKGKVNLATIYHLLDMPGTRQIVFASEDFWLPE
ncbi:hypothetical protein H0G86_013340 [Trichoderma simmonsii]|nr:hypothetical protein H0G86_013340 [Trichoderma simmonsii]